jgi:CheY-like chemotaxis protein
MQLMGTQLNVESTLGQGSVFWFDLDLSPGLSRQETTKADKRSIRGFRGHKRKVLVADDRWENRSIFVNLLLPLGFEVLEATDGRDCLDRALKTKPDAILLDLVMPGINGLDVTRRLRQLPELKDVVILATSTHVFHDSQQNCLLAGCDGFIPQPVQTENLFEQLKVHLDLEWIHEEASDVERLSATSLQPLVAPPPSEMAVLYELAIIGDIKGISEQAKKLEQLNEQFVPFAQQLTQLAKGFQEKQILEFVKRYMVSSG